MTPSCARYAPPWRPRARQRWSATLLARCRVDPEGHGTVVGEGNVHVSPENTGADGAACRTLERLDERFERGQRESRGRRSAIRRSRTLAGRGVQRELAYGEDFSPAIDHRPVHGAF